MKWYNTFMYASS